MEEKDDYIIKICKKQNFEKILLNMKKVNKVKKLKNMFNIIEENIEIEETLKRMIYGEIFDYIHSLNECYEKNIEEVFILGIEETLKQLYENDLLEKSSNIQEIKLKEGKNMEELQDIIMNIKTNGIIRKIDELGRVVIPLEYRKDKVKDGETNVKIYNINSYVIVEILDEKTKKHIKKFDNLGRIVIQIEIRNELKWKPNDEIKIWNYGKYFILQKVKDECIFCGRKDSLVEYKNELLCEECKNAIKTM